MQVARGMWNTYNNQNNNIKNNNYSNVNFIKAGILQTT